MTTAISTIARNSVSDTASFRALAQEVNSLLLASGWVAATDTGQVDLNTVTYTSSKNPNTAQKVYRTNDALDPIYLIVGFGVHNSNQFRVNLQASFSTNGARVATGVYSSVMGSTDSGYNGLLTPYSRPARACSILGCYWLEYADNWGGHYIYADPNYGPAIVFVISRFCNQSGIPTNNGFTIMVSGGAVGTGLNTSYIQQVDRARGVVSPSMPCVAHASCVVPFGEGTGITSEGEPQLWKHYTAQPRPTLNPFVLTRNVQAVGVGTEKQLTVGGQTRNYIAIGGYSFHYPATNTDTGHGLMLPWE